MATPAQGEEVAVLQTNHGRIVLRFFEDKAPQHVKSFKDLARSGFYDGTKFHRVIPNFMIQGGDPNSKSDDRSRHGTGGPGYQLKAEFNDVKHVRGILSAARSGNPDSAGSQFFLMHAAAPHLDRQYTAYGEIVEGLDVLDKIVALPRDQRDNPLPANPAIIEKVTITTYPVQDPA
jgi:cyclophilin family peptidyl-prolyl cis-trans isomerase